jgi:hypothetical protein
LLGTMDAADEEGDQATAQTVEAIGAKSKIMLISIWMSILTALSFTATHVWAV